MYKNNKVKKSKERRHNNRPPSHNRQIKHSKDKDCEWWSDYDSRGNIIHRNTIYNSIPAYRLDRKAELKRCGVGLLTLL